jgi:hypothetical protein
MASEGGTSVARGQKELNLVTNATGQHLGLPLYMSTGADWRLIHPRIRCPVYQAAKPNRTAARIW